MTDRQWLKLSAAVLRRTDLAMGPKVLYARLVDLASIDGNGSCWPSRRRLAAELGAHNDQIERWIAKLVEVGLIRIAEPGRGRTPTRYELVELAPGNGTASGTTTSRGASMPDREAASASMVEASEAVKRRTREARIATQDGMREKVRGLMDERGLTQTELSFDARVTQTIICRWLARKQNLDLVTANRILAVFDLELHVASRR